MNDTQKVNLQLVYDADTDSWTEVKTVELSCWAGDGGVWVSLVLDKPPAWVQIDAYILANLFNLSDAPARIKLDFTYEIQDNRLFLTNVLFQGRHFPVSQ